MSSVASQPIQADDRGKADSQGEHGMLDPSTLWLRHATLSKLFHRPHSELWEAKLDLVGGVLLCWKVGLRDTAMFYLGVPCGWGSFWLRSWEP